MISCKSFSWEALFVKKSVQEYLKNMFNVFSSQKNRNLFRGLYFAADLL